MNVDFFKREIEKVPGPKLWSASRVFILCPFHAETHPSGTISLDPAHPRWLGSFKCWGKCNKTAPWNEVAEKLGLKKLDGKNALPKNVPLIDLKGVRQSLLPEKEKEDDSTRDDFDFFDLQEEKWRGFHKDFLKAVGARLIYHDKSGRFYVWFPVIVNDKEVGYFRALMKKDPNNVYPSYINKKGVWTKKYGLFPFDYAIRLMKRRELSTLVLVEGPRDALRLLKAGIPAVCIMGTNSWTPVKRRVIENSGAKRIILMFDGDKAGRKATYDIYKDLKMHISVKVFRLWRVAKRLGKDKIDPCSAPTETIRQVKNSLR